MKKILLFASLLAGFTVSNAQTTNEDNAWEKIYRASAPKINDLVHTKLDVKFDYDKAYMYGKEWITLKPHFYPTDTLTLDAKGMDIKEVSIVNGVNKTALKYTYDSLQLKINLGKIYKGGENYTVYINYTSKPNERKTHGSAAITDDRGLYFINPKGEDKNSPIQIWTQGETEANSVWMCTIDKPDQKTTEEIYMTVPDRYVTLSNGLLTSQKKNTDGTRTDYWKMDLPHSPYLFFMGVGDYAIIKDSYKGKPVEYYVEKKYAPYARGIFGNTPEMIGFYEKILGVPYQWPKYDQIVGRDYVSGAMENTSATLHQESAYQNARELTDGNSWETVICHELFHQWFGDLVTAESWSNITVNESMADYSQTLWMEHKYGKDAGDEENNNGLLEYLSNPDNDKKDLVRFYYNDKEDVFDLVSYQKGGRILNMLRNYVGDDAFFKSLNVYLTTNKFKNGEAHQMRLAFEEVTGQDMNWYWNQWYFGNGHPILNIDYKYNDATGKAQVIITQKQDGDKIFKLPFAIDVYNGSNKVRTNVWMRHVVDTFTFNYTQRPDLINVDADKILLCEKTDNKTFLEYVFQYKNAPLYLDRKEALDYFNAQGLQALTLGLTDNYAPLRATTINQLADSKFATDTAVINTIETIVNTEKDKKTLAAAISFLARINNPKYLPVYTKYVSDSSYSVAGAALEGLAILQPTKAYDLAKQYTGDMKGELANAVISVFGINAHDEDFDFITNYYTALPISKDKLDLTFAYCDYLSKITDMVKIKKGIDLVTSVGKQFSKRHSSYIKLALDKIGTAKGSGITDYINSVWK